jgi:hypothetical protein
MKRSLAIALLAGALVAGGANAAPRTVTDADAPRALQANGPVSVKWEDPAKFTEIRQSTNRFEAERVTGCSSWPATCRPPRQAAAAWADPR